MPGNASRVARALRTISSNLSQFTEDGEDNLEVISSLEETWKKIGATTGKNLSLYDEQTGQLKNTFDILSDLNSVWPALTKNERNYIAELISGKNNLDVFNALMSNFNSAISANETALNSAGSAAKENAAYMESLEAKVSALKQAFQELSTSIVDDDVAGVVLDVAHSFLELVNTPAGKVLAIGAAFTVVTFAVTSLWKAMDLGGRFMTFLSMGAVEGAAGFAKLNPYLLVALAAVSALVAFSPQIVDFFDKLKDPVGNATKKLEENVIELESAKSNLTQLLEIPWYDRSEEINNEIQELKEYIELLEEANDELNKRKVKAAYKSVTSDKQAPQGWTAGGRVDLGSAQEALDWLEQMYGVAFETVEEAQKAGYTIYESFDLIWRSAEDYYGRIIEEQDKLNKKVALGQTLDKEESAKWNEYNAILTTFVEEVRIGSYHSKDFSEKLLEQSKSAAKLTGEYQENRSALTEQARAQEIAKNGIIISKEAAEEFIAGNEKLADSIGVVSGQLYIESDALYSLASAGNEAAQQIIEAQAEMTRATITATRQRIQAHLAEQAALSPLDLMMNSDLHLPFGSRAQTLKKDQKALEDALAQLAELEGQIGSWNPSGGGGGKKDKKGGKAPSILEGIKEDMSRLQHEIFLLEKQDAEANALAIVDIYIKMQNTVNKKADELRKKGYSETSAEIRELQTMWWGYNDNIEKVYEQIAATEKKFLDDSEKALKAHLERKAKEYQDAADKQKEIMDEANKEADAYKIYAQFVKEAIDEEIAGYRDKIKALEDANEERRNEIALQEKLNNLAKAKDTQVMVYKDGRFQYADDIDAVSSAQSDLNEYQRERELEKEKQHWQDKIDELEDYKKEWQNFTKDYEDSANLQILIENELFNKEDLIFSNRIKSAQNFADKYAEAMRRARAAALEMESLQNISTRYGESASNIGGSGTDWSKAWRDVDALQKSGQISNEAANALKKDYHDKKTEEMKGSGKIYDPGSGTWNTPKYAGGTLSAIGGLSLVGEDGPEMRILNSGDGIMPSDITKNLMALGSNPYAFLSNAYRSLAGSGSNSTAYQFMIDKLELPNVGDAPSFVEGLRRYAYQYTTQRT